MTYEQDNSAKIVMASMQWPRSTCVYVQSDQGLLHYVYILQYLVIIQAGNKDSDPSVQAELGLCCLDIL